MSRLAFGWVACCLMSMASQEAVAQSSDLKPSVEVSSRSIMAGDPLYAKITLTNTTNSTISIPSLEKAFPQISASTPSRSYDYRWKHSPAILTKGMALSRQRIIPPGESIRQLVLLEVPPIEDRQHRFWKGAISDQSITLSFEFASPLVGNHQDIDITIQLKDRPQREWELIESTSKISAYDRFQPEITQARWEPGTPVAALNRYASDSETVADRLSAHLTRLSAGSLKNSLITREHFQTIANRDGSLTDDQRRLVVKDLLNWLKTLNDVEAAYLSEHYMLNYVQRITSDETLAASDQVFLELEKSLQPESE